MEKPLRHPKVITDLEREERWRKLHVAIRSASTQEEIEAIYEEHSFDNISRDEYITHILAECRLCMQHERTKLRPHSIE